MTPNSIPNESHKKWIKIADCHWVMPPPPKLMIDLDFRLSLGDVPQPLLKK